MGVLFVPLSKNVKPVSSEPSPKVILFLRQKYELVTWRVTSSFDLGDLSRVQRHRSYLPLRLFIYRYSIDFDFSSHTLFSPIV